MIPRPEIPAHGRIPIQELTAHARHLTDRISLFHFAAASLNRSYAESSDDERRQVRTSAAFSPNHPHTHQTKKSER